MTCTIVIDTENNAERFWDAFRSASPSDPYVAEWHRKLTARGVERLEGVPNDAADALVEWASELPEWDEGPEYARHPFFLAPDEDPS